MLGRRELTFAIVLTAVVAVGLVVTRPVAPGPQAIIAVDTAIATGTIQTRLGTQFVLSGALDRSPAAHARFTTLAAPLVRINATTIGSGWVLPAGKTRGDWSFGGLDSLVNDIGRAGGQVLLAVAYAPEWMWDCAGGGIRDPTFAEFAGYLDRLVGYFNRGSFVAEDGRTVTNPAGRVNRITYWELWNEPDVPDSCPPAGNHLTVSQYVTMWNAAAPRMLAVDPSIKLVGPATANATTAGDSDYLPALMSRAAHKPDIVSFHGYGGWLSSQTDRFLFVGGDGSFGLDGIERGLARVKAWAPGVPVWVTELNVNSAFDQRREAQRAWDGFGAAWGASAFRRLALGGADALFQYQFSHPELRQFSLVDAQSGAPLLPYWRDYYLARYFPPGSTVLSSSSSLAGVETLAVRPPGSANVHVLVVNRQLDSATAVGGPGAPAAMRVNVRNLAGLTALTIRSLDASTPLDTGPAARMLPVEAAVTVNFSGYGVALLEFVAGDAASS